MASFLNVLEFVLVLQVLTVSCSTLNREARCRRPTTTAAPISGPTPAPIVFDTEISFSDVESFTFTISSNSNLVVAGKATVNVDEGSSGTVTGHADAGTVSAAGKTVVTNKLNVQVSDLNNTIIRLNGKSRVSVKGQFSFTNRDTIEVIGQSTINIIGEPDADPQVTVTNKT